MSDVNPIPMRLACEGCGKLHIDEGEFASKPHHTHSCQHCGLTWRPAVVPTVGVRFLPGFKNEAVTAPLKVKAVSSPSACDHESHDSGDPRCQHPASCSCRVYAARR